MFEISLLRRETASNWQLMYMQYLVWEKKTDPVYNKNMMLS